MVHVENIVKASSTGERNTTALGAKLALFVLLVASWRCSCVLSTSPSSELLLHQQEQNQAPGTTGVLTVLPRTQHIAMNTYKVWCISSKTKYIPKTQEMEQAEHNNIIYY